MKTILLSLATLINVTMGILAEEVEFRLVTLRGAGLSDERIQELLSDGGLGLEHRQLVVVKEGELSFDDTEEVQYPTEFSREGVVSARDVKKLGTLISGNFVREGEWQSLALEFSYSVKTGDQVYESQDGKSFVMPLFHSVSTSGERMIKDGDKTWHLMRLPTGDEKVAKYLAFRIQKEAV